jgi:sugar phosphate isomerase/epimerase
VKLDSLTHLAYCTNIHPAETWEETFAALKTHPLAVRDRLSPDAPFAIGLRLSARAAADLLTANRLAEFRDWLQAENCYVFTINGFPFGAFHGTAVKKDVFRPDWSTPERLNYTKDLFTILSQILPAGVDGSVSTLPGSFKTFGADRSLVIANLLEIAAFIDALASVSGQDLHLGLEPEPFGLFENTAETLVFFDDLLDAAGDPEMVRRRIGINYDCCHFAIQYDDCAGSLEALRAAGLRISKVHLSNALALDPRDPAAVARIAGFREPTYLHQVITRAADGALARHIDLPDFLTTLEGPHTAPAPREARVHFHIPLYAEPEPPLRSTRFHAEEALAYLADHPGFCSHFEIETYTWGVLPEMQRPIAEMIAAEYAWVLDPHLRAAP